MYFHVGASRAWVVVLSAQDFEDLQMGDLILWLRSWHMEI